MRRREFVALIGGAAFAMPNVARPQQHAMLVITLVSAFVECGGHGLTLVGQRRRNK